MLYALAANGSVGHVVSSQSNEKSELYTVCGKTLSVNNLVMVEDVDVCKQCDNKVEDLIADDTVVETVKETPKTETKTEPKTDTKTDNTTTK